MTSQYPTVDGTETLASVPHSALHNARPPMLVVAPSDAPAAVKKAADYVCDGTADDVEIQEAIDALPANGGMLVIAAGGYNLAASPFQSVNKRVLVSAYGAVLNLAADVTAFKVSQGISTARGVTLMGARISGGGNSGTVGVEFEDTNNSRLVDVEINDCAVGWLLESKDTGKFVEGSQGDNVLIRNCTEGLKFAVDLGTGSFMQTSIRGLKIVVGAGGTGIVIPSGALLLRSVIEATIWIDSNETAVSIDGNIEDAVLDLAIEGSGGSTGNVGVVVGSNAAQTEQAWIRLKFTGTVNTQLNNAGTKNFNYSPRGDLTVFSTGTAVYGYRRHGDTTDRLRLEALTAGPRISGGAGSSIDVNFYRSVADRWVTDDKWDPASLNLPTKAGVPVDGDVVGGAQSGDVIYDTTNDRLYVRSGSTWRANGHLALPSRGGTLLDPAGAINVIVWRAPFACTVTNVRGYRVGGSGATINARRNGTDNHLASALSLTGADSWTDGGAVQNTAYAAGDKLEIMVVSVTGAPTQVAIQVDFTRP